MPEEAGSRVLRTAVVIGSSHRQENPWSGAIRAKPRRSRAKRAGAAKSDRQDRAGATQTLRSISDPYPFCLGIGFESPCPLFGFIPCCPPRARPRRAAPLRRELPTFLLPIPCLF